MNNNPAVVNSIIDCDAFRPGHFILNSGLHSDAILDMNRLRDDYRSLVTVMGTVATKLFEDSVKILIPVPTGPSRLIDSLNSRTPFVLPFSIFPKKIASREFLISNRKQRKAIEEAEEATVFEDVVTTGGSPAALADHIRTINPDIKLDLIAIWRRGKVSKQASEKFRRQFYLVEEEIPSWTTQDCPRIDCKQ